MRWLKLSGYLVSTKTLVSACCYKRCERGRYHALRMIAHFQRKWRLSYDTSSANSVFA
jgi:hypothetical protein